MRQGIANQYASRAHQWNQRGQIYLWRYLENQRNYPDWSLSLDPLALESLRVLFRFLHEDETRCHRTLVSSEPTAAILRVPNNRGGTARFTSPGKIRLYFDPAAEVGWKLAESGDPLQWQLGPSGLAETVEFLTDPEDYFDGALGGEVPVWWWGTAAAAPNT